MELLSSGQGVDNGSEGSLLPSVNMTRDCMPSQSVTLIMEAPTKSPNAVLGSNGMAALGGRSSACLRASFGRVRGGEGRGKWWAAVRSCALLPLGGTTVVRLSGGYRGGFFEILSAAAVLKDTFGSQFSDLSSR